MDDIRAHARRRTRPTTAPSSPSELGRARGRTQLRPPYSTSYGADSTNSSTLSVFGESSRSSSSGAGVKSKIMSSVRRSLSYGAPGKKRDAGLAASGMYSTPEESLPPTQSRNAFHERPLANPTIEQIAMGLHISRTPHLGSSKAYNTRVRHRDILDTPSRSVSSPSNPSRPTHRRRVSAPPSVIQLPPPPARSSLKKPTPDQSSRSLSAPLTPTDSYASLSTLTSTGGPSTPRSNRSNSASKSVKSSTFASRLQYGMSRLLLPMRKSSQSVTTLSTTSSDSASAELTPRKVVRFSTLTGTDGDCAS